MIHRVRMQVIALSLLAVLLLGAVGGGPVLAQSSLSLGTHPLGSLFAVVGAGVATVLTNHTDINVRAVPTDGPSTWMPMLVSGEMDLGVANAFDSYMGWLGEDVYSLISGGRGFPVRVVVVGSPLPNGLLVRADSDIRSGKDVAGKRVVTQYSGSGALTSLAQGFLANYGYTPADVRGVTVPGITDGVQALIEGRADAAVAALSIPLARELDAVHGARFVGIDPSPEAVERFREHFPVVYALEVAPGPNTVGIEEPTHYAAYDSYLVARESLSEDVVYELTKAIWNHYEELGEIHPDLRNWNPSRFATELTTVPYHPGAVRFFKEQGVWTDAMQARQDELLAQKR